MTKRIFIPLLGALFLPHGLHAATPQAMEKEYQQVRTIALRDARVQAAYRDADRRLDAKILQIDPALEPVVRAKQAAREGVPAPAATKRRDTTERVPPPKPAAAKGTHVVAAGETLGGIAAKHHVSVGALKSANRISDERKLRVGQVLAIPSGKAAAPAKKDEGVWSRLMH